MAELKESDIRKLTEEAVRQLGMDATPESVERIVKESIKRIDPEITVAGGGHVQGPAVTAGGHRGNRIIVTAFGKNRVGILAGLTGVLARQRCDILDLSQKILQEFFTIMLLVDISGSELSFEQVREEITRKGEELDLKVIIQHEEIFNAMHRV